MQTPFYPIGSDKVIHSEIKLNWQRDKFFGLTQKWSCFL